MKSLLTKLLPLILLFAFHAANAQYYLVGQDPASIKWRQINTAEFQIIYPENYAERAQYYINSLSLSAPYNNSDYNSHTRKVSVILHNRTTVSNAVTPIAPSRMDFYEMQSQSTYPQIWPDQLTLHEYRHHIQQDKMWQGLTKGLYYVFGEQGVAFILGLYIPFWLMEGDAVYAETIHSSSGRGRVPDFVYPLKAQFLDNKIYKYDKAVYGSYRDFVPDHYTLGYQLMARGTERYGMGLWDKTFDLVARRPYYILPFTISLKKQTGFFKVRYYNQVMNELKQEWWIHDQPGIDSTNVYISKKAKHYTNYRFANVLSDGSVIAEKIGIDDINRFVRIYPDGHEKTVFTPGFDQAESLSANDSIVCWSERTYDPRWDLRDYSVIKTYNFKTDKLNKLTSRSRYFAPTLSGSGKYIAAVRVTEQSAYFLDILDANTGIIIKEIHTEDNLFFITPHWFNDDKYIVTAVLGKKGKSLLLINTENWNLIPLLDFSFTEIKWPIGFENWVVFTGTYAGKDNLYAIDTKSGTLFSVYNARFGANYATFADEGKNLLVSCYTADGDRLVKIPFQAVNFKKIKLPDLHHEYLADRLVNSTTFNLDETEVPDSVYQTKKYSKAAHLFNLHSWAPVSIDANNYTINPGATLLSQNKLGTAVSSVNYTYNINEKTNRISFGFDYYGWYPVISLNVDYGGRRGVHHPDSTRIIHYKWNETNLSLAFSLPLNFTSSKWIKGIQPIVGINQKFRKIVDNDSLAFKENSITAPYYRFYAYNQLKRSAKDIYPKWGQTIDLIYRDTPFSKYVNSQLGLTAWFYFPGIWRHQGIRIYGGFQKLVTGSYSFSNFVALPRGYSDIYDEKYFTLRSDYAFPVAYPDLDIPGVFYLKRIYAKLFYDYMHGTISSGKLHDLSSFGAEVYTDWHFLSVLVNFNLGLRVSHRVEDNSQFYEFLFGFSY